MSTMSRPKRRRIKFDEQETKLFVKLYLGHDCLWVKDHEFYKSKSHRETALRDISEKFAAETNILLDLNAIRNKITILRSTYLQELKAMTTRSTPDEPYIPTLKWFNAFHKCFRDMKMKEEDSEQISEEDNNSGHSTQEIWLETKDTMEVDNLMTPENYLQLLKTEPEEEIEKDYKRRNRKGKIRIMKNRSCGDSDNIQLRSRKLKYRSDSEETSSKTKDDEFDIYGKYIASQLREMGLHKALRVQLKIQSIVREARMENMPGNEP